MTELTFYETPGPARSWWAGEQLEPGADWHPVELRHGYTIRDVNAAVRIGLKRTSQTGFTTGDRYEIAWSGTVLALYEAEKRPAFLDLIAAASLAVRDTVRANNRHHGRPDPHLGTTGINHVIYWTAPDAPVFDRFEERLAIHQVWWALADADRETIGAMAAAGTQREAAELVGIAYAAYSQRLKKARKRAAAIWFDGYTTPEWMTDGRVRHPVGRPQRTHCNAGHEYTPETTREPKPGSGQGRQCLLCNRIRDARRRRRS